MMLTALADVARQTGYPVIELAGWKTRGDGVMSGVQTITCHHTADGGAKGNYPSLKVVRDGRPGLPGPLAQYGLGRDGTIYVIAAGKCNHAGVSRARAYTNPWAIGIEAEAVGVPGTVGDWPAKQMDSYARLCRVLIDHYDLNVADVRGHKETCAPVGRKTDPDFSMTTHRGRVATVHLASSPATPPTPLETDMDWTTKIPLTATDAAVMNRTIAKGQTPFKTGQLVTFADMVKYPTLARKMDTKLDGIVAAIAQLAAAGAATAAAVHALGGFDGGITAAQIEAAAKAGADAALAALGDALHDDDEVGQTGS
jgi:N-acetylmuramoyl-L-alanine amidase